MIYVDASVTGMAAEFAQYLSVLVPTLSIFFDKNCTLMKMVQGDPFFGENEPTVASLRTLRLGVTVYIPEHSLEIQNLILRNIFCKSTIIENLRWSQEFFLLYSFLRNGLSN